MTESNRKNLEFNYDDILQLDSLTDLLASTDVNTREASGSRFSQWFNQASPSKQQKVEASGDRGSRRSSLYDDNQENVAGLMTPKSEC